MNELNIKLTLDQANVILEALGNMPFARVYQLVGVIQAQANEQLGGEQKVTPPVHGKNGNGTPEEVLETSDTLN